MKEKTKLDWREWNFDGISDGKLRACCWWEYARESASIGKAGRRHREAVNQYDPSKQATIKALRAAATDVALIRQHCPFLAETILTTKGAFALPAWQSLPKDKRPKLTGTQALPAAFNRGACEYAHAIVEAGAEYTRSVLRDAKSCAGWIVKPSSLIHNGHETGVFSIGWGTYTNDEIAEAFRKWVKANRPPDVKAPDRRGRHKSNVWRAMLTRLAAMRLLHHYTAIDILGANTSRVEKSNKSRGKGDYSDKMFVENFIRGMGRSRRTPPLPECEPIRKAKQFRGDSWLEPGTWYGARRDAPKDFFALFPFLPHNEKPCSWQTKGGTT